MPKNVIFSQCQRKKKYQELYEGLLTRESLLKQEVTDLKLTLHQTQQGSLIVK